MKKSIYIFTLMLLGISINAQDHFQVVFEPVSPPVEELIKGHVGFPAIPVMANDIEGNSHSIAEMKGKTVLLYFWNQECATCFDHLEALHKLQAKYKNELQILSFSDDDKETSIKLVDQWQIKFPVIPSSKVLADGPYTGALGYPRLFVIDEYGVVKTVLSQENFETQGLLLDKVEKQYFASK